MKNVDVTFHFANLAKHGIMPSEAAEALEDGWKRRRKDGVNYEVLGVTAEGRHLQLVVEVGYKVIRIFHGRDMNDAERRRYQRK